MQAFECMVMCKDFIVMPLAGRLLLLATLRQCDSWEATVAGDTATVRQFKLMNPHVTIQVFESNWVNGAQREISKYVVGADQSVAYFREDIVHQCGTEATEENVHKWITEIKTFTAMPSLTVVKKKVKELNDKWSILPTPNETHGVQQSLSERLAFRIGHLLECAPKDAPFR